MASDPPEPGGRGPTFAVSFGRELGEGPVDGRVLLLISTDPSDEPRFQITDTPRSQLAFGVDVEGLAPGREVVFDSTVLGYPLESLRQVSRGTYRVQALLHKYETFRRLD